jgi:hypothetical protein
MLLSLALILQFLSEKKIRKTVLEVWIALFEPNDDCSNVAFTRTEQRWALRWKHYKISTWLETSLEPSIARKHAIFLLI